MSDADSRGPAAAACLLVRVIGAGNEVRVARLGRWPAREWRRFASPLAAASAPAGACSGAPAAGVSSSGTLSTAGMKLWMNADALRLKRSDACACGEWAEAEKRVCV